MSHSLLPLQVWVLEYNTMEWHKPTVAGKTAPAPRYGHCAAVIDYKIYIFGGKGENGLMLNDLWCLDVESWSWELMPSTSAPPSPRLGASMLAVDGKLLVCFGWDSKNDTYNDCWVYNREQYQWTKPRLSGLTPPTRYFASTVLDEPNGRVLCYGGANLDAAGKPGFLKDTRELNLRTMTWSRSQISGDYPPARYWHAASVIGNVMVTSGGWHGPDKTKDASGSKTVDGAGGSVLSTTSSQAMMTVYQPGTPGTVTIPHQAGMGFGVEAPEGATITVPYSTHADTFFLDLDSLEWVQPQVAGRPPGYRYGASACACGLQVLMWGGWEDGRPMSELLVLDMTAIAAPA